MNIMLYKYTNNVIHIANALLSNSLSEQTHTGTRNPFLDFAGTYCVSSLSYNHDVFNTTHEIINQSNTITRKHSNYIPYINHQQTSRFQYFKARIINPTRSSTLSTTANISLKIWPLELRWCQISLDTATISLMYMTE